METRIPVVDGDINGYLAKPQTEVAGQPPWPGVVIVHDVFGLTKEDRGTAERFATGGYLALSPDLYSRGGRVRCVKSVFRDCYAGKGRAFEDIESARTMLAGRSDCTGKIGIVGFCLGGGFALVAAGGTPSVEGSERKRFDASAPYYGNLPNDMSILDDACPIVASFGKKDPSLRGAAKKLEAALTERRVPHDVKEYPNAGHNFANQSVPQPINSLLKIGGFAYHHESSEDAWRRVFAFFAEHLR